MHRKLSYTFNEQRGSIEIEGRRIRAYNGETVAWERQFHTRREAESSFNSDVRSMRKNDTYKWEHEKERDIA